MRAPVYRHLDATARFAGLTFPVEWMMVLGVAVVPAELGAPGAGILGAAILYVFLRVATYGRPEHHIQDYGIWLVRKLVYRGRLSAAARAPAPRFPFAKYQLRDAPRRGAGRHG